MSNPVQAAHKATAKATEAENDGCFSEAAGYYRIAAELWRNVDDEDQAERCEYKADEMEDLL